MNPELTAINLAISVLQELASRLEADDAGAAWHFQPIDATHKFLRSNVVSGAAVTLQTNPSATPVSVSGILVQFAPY